MKITRLRKPIELNERLRRQVSDLLSSMDFCHALKKHFKQTPGEYRNAEAVTLSPNE